MNYPLSDDTVEILQNFANISPQIIFKAGTTQRTCNATRNFIADIELPEAIPTDCAIYDLNRLLGIIDTCKGQKLPELTFDTTSLTVKHDHGEVLLPYAAANVIPAPPAHKFTLTKQFASFDLPASLWQQIKRTAAVLKTTTLQFIIDDSRKLTVKLIDEKDTKTGWGSFNMPNSVVDPKATAAAWVLKFDSLQLLPGNYKVELGDVSFTSAGGATSTIFGAFFTLNDPKKKAVYLTSGHVTKTR